MRKIFQDLRQFTLDLFDDAPVATPQPQRVESNRPLAGENTAQVAINNIANEFPAPPAESLTDVMAPLAFTHPRANREAALQGSVVAFEFKRAKRRTIGFVVGADGLVVSAPKWVPLPEVDKALQEKAGWVMKKLAEAQDRRAKSEERRIEWKDGALVPFLGEQVIVVLDPRHAFNGAAQLNTDANALPGVPKLTLHVGLPHDADAQRIRDAVQAWLMRQAKRIFEERLNHFAPQLNVQWRKLSLSSAGTRWGSASADGAIRLNWRLVHFRMSAIDYVVVHELSHLRVMDHSPKFWGTVEAILPDYAERKSELKDEALPRWD
jgi:predicted metal-dependent hydrolase